MDRVIGKLGVTRLPSGTAAPFLHKVATITGLCTGLAIEATGCGGSSSSNGGTGGAGGLGVDAGSGGSSQPDGATPDVISVVPPGTTIIFPFMSDADWWALDTFSNPGPYTDGNPQNLGGALDASVHPMASWDGTAGMPDPGALLITATFTDFNQTVNVHRPYPATATISLAGKILTAQIRLDPGASFTGIAHLFALSTPSPPKPAPGYFFAQGNSILLQDNNWHTLTFDLSVPEFAAVGFDPSDIVQICIQLASGVHAVSAAGPTTVTYGAPQSISIRFDSVTTN